MHPIYDFAGADPAAFELSAWFNLIGAAGCICWVIAYVLIVRKSYLDKANGLPMVAVGLNFSWELLASFFFPNPVKLWHAFDRIWLGVDVIIVSQLLLYGRAFQRIPEIRQGFYWIFAVVVFAGFVGQYTFVVDYSDRLGLVIAFLINLVMSILFVFMYFDRRDDRRGISVGGAWFKMLGTLGTSIECHVVVRMIDPEMKGVGFVTFLSAMIFVVDCLYIWLVSRKPGPR